MLIRVYVARVRRVLAGVVLLQREEVVALGHSGEVASWALITRVLTATRTLRRAIGPTQRISLIAIRHLPLRQGSRCTDAVRDQLELEPLVLELGLVDVGGDLLVLPGYSLLRTGRLVLVSLILIG